MVSTYSATDGHNFRFPITRDPATAARVGGLQLINVKSGTYGLPRTA